MKTKQLIAAHAYGTRVLFYYGKTAPDPVNGLGIRKPDDGRTSGRSHDRVPHSHHVIGMDGERLPRQSKFLKRQKARAERRKARLDPECIPSYGRYR